MNTPGQLECTKGHKFSYPYDAIRGLEKVDDLCPVCTRFGEKMTPTFQIMPAALFLKHRASHKEFADPGDGQINCDECEKDITGDEEIHISLATSEALCRDCLDNLVRVIEGAGGKYLVHVITES